MLRATVDPFHQWWFTDEFGTSQYHMEYAEKEAADKELATAAVSLVVSFA